MNFGQRVKELRNKKGLSLRKLALESGISHATISRIESGQIKELKSEALKGLAKALGCTVDYLVGMTSVLTPGDVIKVDSEVGHLVEKFHGLSTPHRRQAIEFVEFLATQERQGYKEGPKSQAKKRRSRRVEKKIEPPIDEDIPSRILPNFGE